MADAVADGEKAPTNVREIYRGRDFHVHYFECCCGPEDPAFEEAHEYACVAAVLAGSFTYRTGKSTAFLSPGSLLLGNKGETYLCGHEHSRGDISLVFGFGEPILGCIAELRGANGRTPAFELSSLAPAPHLSTVIGRAQSAARIGDSLWLEEVAYLLAETALFPNGPETSPKHRAACAEIRRTADALRYIEENFSSALTLAELADVAGTSPFHFLRTFRAVTGTTPYRYVVQMRLREAALRLAGTNDPVTHIAFDVGFGDLSQFVRTFKRASGLSPGAFRKAPPPRSLATSFA